MIKVIFDVDGTLVDTEGFDGDLYIQAVRDVYGGVHLHDDWGLYEHVTDTGCLRQILRENGIAVTDQAVMPVRSRFGELVAAYLYENPCRQIPGAAGAMAQILADPSVSCGIATGGWGHTAVMKLQSAGIETASAPIYSSDHHHERPAIMDLCNDSLSPEADRVVYIGDGSWDVRASAELHWGFIGVGEKLRDKTAHWIPDFCDPGWRHAIEKAARGLR